MHELMWLGGITKSSPVFARSSYWAGIILSSAVFIYAVLRLLRREGLGLDDRVAQMALAAALVITLSSFKAPGIITGLVIVLLGYANGNRVLTGLAFSLSLHTFLTTTISWRQRSWQISCAWRDGNGVARREVYARLGLAC